MPYVNEFMSSSDIAKYDIVTINNHYFRDSFKPHWTVDRARDIYGTAEQFGFCQ